MPARLAHPLADAEAWTSVERNDHRLVVVERVHADGDDAGRLEDLEGARGEPDLAGGNAPLPDVAVAPVVALPAVSTRRFPRLQPIDGVKRQRRHPPVRRIDDQRRPVPRHGGPGVRHDPEPVVLLPEDPLLGGPGPGRQRGVPGIRVLGIFGFRRRRVFGQRLDTRRDLFVRQELPRPELRGTLHRRAGVGAVPDPLQVRIAPPRARRRPGGRSLCQRRRHQRDRQQQRRQRADRAYAKWLRHGDSPCFTDRIP